MNSRARTLARVLVVVSVLLAVSASLPATAQADLAPDHVLTFGSAGSGPGQFDRPRGADVDAQGNLYVADDFASRLQKFAPDGQHLATWVGFSRIADVEIGPDGLVYVADQNTNLVKVFDQDGNFVSQVGGLGSGPGELDGALGVAVDAQGFVYATDRNNNRVNKYSFDGVNWTFLTSWGSLGSGPGQFNAPTGIATDSSGFVYVAEQFNNRVQKFDAAGNYVLEFGGLGAGDGQFNTAYGIAVDDHANVYVTDEGNSRIQKFDADGNFLVAFGGLGTSDGQFDRPRGVSVSNDGRTIHVIDTYNYRVQEFSYRWMDIARGQSLDDAGPNLGVAWGDIDGDGDPDLFTTSENAPNRLWRNDGGTFTDLGTGPWTRDGFPSTGAQFVDLDGDGDLDLFICGQDGEHVLVENLMESQPGAFQVGSTEGIPVNVYSAFNATWADYDLDGDLDGYVATGSGHSAVLLRNEGRDPVTGAFRFTDATPPGLVSTSRQNVGVWGDYDGDGDPDLYMTTEGGSTSNRLYRNEGDGNFTDVTPPLLAITNWCRGAAWGDVDDDGDLDLYVSVAGPANKLFRNDGDGNFTDITTPEIGVTGDAETVAFVDFDNDGRLDLYAHNWGSANRVLRNLGGGAFEDVTGAYVSDPSGGVAAAWADFDGDGDLDHYQANFNAPNRLVLNQEANGHWLRIDLRGSASNSFGVGARIELTAAGVTQTREIIAGGGHMAAPELTAHFGLGASTIIDALTIRWPSGKVQQVTPPAVDQRIVVSEPPDFAETTSGALVGRDAFLALWSDYDLDGDQDVFVVSDTGQDSWLRNDGGTFVADYQAALDLGPAPDLQVVLGDFDGDGDEDMLRLRLEAAPRLLRNDAGSFVDVTPAAFSSLTEAWTAAWLDLEGDGDLDLYAGMIGSGGLPASVPNRLFVNNGGVFTDATVPPLDDDQGTTWVSALDLDGDGDTDLALGKFGSVKLLENKGGSFVASEFAFSGMADTSRPVFGDMDGDGDLDLYLANASGRDFLYENQAGSFVDTGWAPADGAASGGSRAQWVDADLDGDLDVFVVSFDQGLQLLENVDGAGTLVPRMIGLESISAIQSTWNDVDGDGDPDLLLAGVPNLGPQPSLQLFRNDYLAQGNWLQVDLTGTASTARAATIEVQTFSGTQVRQLVAEAGNQLPLRANFGLGGDLTVDRVTVRWSSGVVQEAGPFSANQRIQLTESAGLGLVASQDLYEDRVELQWDAASGSGFQHRVLRDGSLLSVLASTVTRFADTTGDPDVSYQYTVERRDTRGVLVASGSASGSRSLFEPIDVQASDLLFVDGVRVQWTDLSNVEAGYHVYRADTPGNFVLLGTTPANYESYDDDTAVAGVVYEYAVAAFDANGFETDLPPFATVDVTDEGSRGFVLPPSDVVATDGQYVDKVQLTWTDVSGDELGYFVYRTPLAGGSQQLLATLPPNATSYADTTGLGQPYSYCVTSFRGMASLATSSGLAKAPTATVESTPVCDEGIGGPITMALPANVQATDGTYDEMVLITWEDAGDAEDGYEIHSASRGVIATLDADVTRYEDRAILPGLTDTYCVVPISDLGGSGDPAGACDQGSRNVIVHPTSVVASDGQFEDRVVVSWQSASTTVVLFKIYRDGTLIKTVAGTERSVVDADVDTAQHTYCVTAVTAGDVESPLGQADCDTGFRTLTAPTNVAATDDAFEHLVRITWRDVSLAEGGYRVFRALAADPPGSEVAIAEVNANRTVYEDLQAVPDRVYRYGVVAFDRLGGVSAMSEDPAGSRRLRAVENLAATQGEFEDVVELTWTDTSAHEINYEVYRRPVGGNWSKVATLIEDAEAYGVPIANAGDEFEFHVRPIDALSVAPTIDPLVDPVALGSTALLAPGSVSASEGYTDRVVVAWDDLSQKESGYEVLRNGVLLTPTPLAPNTSSFTDSTPLGTIADYCVRAVSASQVSIEVCDEGSTTTSSGGTTTIVSQQIDSPSQTAGKRFGSVIDIKGDRAIVGAPGNRWGNVFEPATPGSVYIYERIDCSDQWIQVAAIPDPDNGANNFFGWSVAIDGDLAVVGAPGNPGSFGANTGRVYFLRKVNGAWNYFLVQEGGQAGEDYGYSVDLDAGTAVISWLGGVTTGGRFETWGYTQSGTVFQGIYNASDQVIGDNFGQRVVIDGDRIAVSARGAVGNAVYVFERAGGQWTQTQKIGAPFGSLSTFASSMSMSGDVIAIGDPGLFNEFGSAYVFELADDGAWRSTQRLKRPDGAFTGFFGTDVAVSGSHLVVGSLASTNWVFTRATSGKWEAVAVGSGGREVAIDQEIVMTGENAGNFVGVARFGTSNAGPGSVQASQSFDDRVVVSWPDEFGCVDGYTVYRDGELLGTTDRSPYIDFDAVPGVTYAYRVDASTANGAFPGAVDYGRRPANGSIAGRVATAGGAGVDGVQVCLDPPPSSAVILDGVSGRIRVDDPKPPTGDFTLEMWVKTSNATNAGTLFAYSGFSQINDLFYLVDQRNLRVRLGNAQATTGVAVNDGKWHHLAFSWRRSDGETRLYKDGLLVFTANVGAGYAVPHDGYLSFGQSVDYEGIPGDGTQFSGMLDDIRWWSRVRSAEEIARDRTRTLQGTEEGLLSYWPLDQFVGAAAADRTGNGADGVLTAGAHWAANGADPIVACVTTDTEGNYAVGGIQYGGSTTFEVRPTDPARRFQPAFKTVVLSPGSPVENGVDFLETTTFTVSGTVQYRGQDFTCFPPSVTLKIDGLPKGNTDPEGRFDLALTPGRYLIEPFLEGHTFDPAFLELDVVGDTPGQDFDDVTQRRLTGLAAGGCDFSIGDVDLLILSEDGCLERRLTANGPYALVLPPARYFVVVEDVRNVPAPLDEGAVFEFFRRLGSREVDLTEADAELDFQYRAPLRLAIEGLPAIDPACIANGGFDLPTGGKGAAASVLRQGDRATLTVRVFEDYGNGNLCVAESGTVLVYDEFLDTESTPTALTIVDGIAEIQTDDGRVPYETAANTPSIFSGREGPDGEDRSYQKLITFVTQVEGQEPAIARQWGLITGHRPRQATFTTRSTGIPLLILRDPPGDRSSATVSSGQTFCTTLTDTAIDAETLGIRYELKVGLKFLFGLGTLTEQDAFLQSKGMTFETSINSITDEIEVCATTTEEFSTSSDNAFVGPDGDVYMGVGLNFSFAKTDVVALDGCRIRPSVDVAVGPTGYNTTYNYTQAFIRDTLVAQWQEILDADPQDVLAQRTRDDWQRHLALNQVLKDQSTFKRNRSFSAGADYLFSETNTETDRVAWETTLVTEAEIATNVGFELGGAGGQSGYWVNLNTTLVTGGSEESSNGRTVAYTLSDDDPGDFFSVDIKEDDQYRTPVFEVKSGTSSCPWEQWTDAAGNPRMQSRDAAILAVDGPTLQEGVPADEAAVFTLFLKNDSPSGEARPYVIFPLQASNPYGAVMRLNGDAFSGGTTVILEPQQVQEVTLSIARGPIRYQYDDLRILMTPACTFEVYVADNIDLLTDPLTDVLDLSVHFEAACSDVTLQVPEPGWVYNADDEAGDGIVRVRATDFVLEISDTKTLSGIRAEYRLSGTPNWLPIGSVAVEDIPVDPVTGTPRSVTFDWDVAGGQVPEGQYDVRVVTVCETGLGFSNVSTGRIDRTAPLVIATQPADGVLSLGDPISIRYNEPIDCNGVSASLVSLRNLTQGGVPIQARVVCDRDEGTLVITPTNPPLGQLEDDLVEVTVESVPDQAGNSAPVTIWQFQVQRSAFTWSSPVVSKAVPFGRPSSFTVNLVNGGLADRTFAIVDALGGPLPAWITARPASGTIRAQETVPVVFSSMFSSPGDLGGNFAASIEARLLDGPTVVSTSTLDVSLDVECQAPVLPFAESDFEYNMTIVARMYTGDLNPQVSNDPADRLVAYVGSQIRGIGAPELVGGDWVVFLPVYSNQPGGDVVRFEVWDDSDCRQYSGSDRYFQFQSDARIGSIQTPEEIRAKSVANTGGLNVDVAAGWTWFSINRSAADLGVPAVLGNLNPSTGDVVKGIDPSGLPVFSQFTEGVGWVGSLDSFSPLTSYQLRASEAGQIQVQGGPVPVNSTPVPIGPNWNSIGFLPQTAVAVADALQNLTPSDGDLLKSQTAFAQYDAGSGTWRGTLTTMVPGQGYRLYLSAPTQSEFLYATTPLAAVVFDDGLRGGRKAGAMIAEGLSGGDGDEGAALAAPTASRGGHRSGGGATSGSSEPTTAARAASAEPVAPTFVESGPWSFDPHAFEHSMTLTASLSFPDATPVREDMVVAAMVDGEVRGLASPRYLDLLRSYRVFLMVFGEEGEQVDFVVFDPMDEAVWSTLGDAAFETDGTLGDALAPYAVQAHERGALVEAESRFLLRANRPNPFRAGQTTVIQFSVPRREHVVLKVFDLRGRLVQTLVDEERSPGWHDVLFDARDLANGVYLYRMQAGDFVDTRKMTILK